MLDVENVMFLPIEFVPYFVHVLRRKMTKSIIKTEIFQINNHRIENIGNEINGIEERIEENRIG